MNFALFKELKIMLFAIAKCCTNNLLGAFINYKLAL